MNNSIIKQYTDFINKQNNSKKIIEQQENSLIDTYLKFSNLISEQDDDLQDDIDEDLESDAEDEDLEEDDKELEDSEQTKDEENTEEQTTDDKADLKFSADLASEFGNTVNQFTKTAAEVIKQRSINKETSDKIYDLMAKIKNLLDAAGKSI